LGIGVAVGSGVDVNVCVGIVVGGGVAVEGGATVGWGGEAGISIPHEIKMNDRMIEDVARNFILFILSF